MTKQVMDYKLRQYIWENKDKYTRSAITDKLLEQGYTVETINQAWHLIVELGPGVRGAPVELSVLPERLRDYPRFNWALWGYFLGLPVLIGLISHFAGGAQYYTYSANLALNLVIGAIVVGILATIVTWNIDRPVSRGLMYGVICFVCLPFISITIILGVCII